MGRGGGSTDLLLVAIILSLGGVPVVAGIGQAFGFVFVVTLLGLASYGWLIGWAIFAYLV
jgi:hypothetical protein